MSLCKRTRFVNVGLAVITAALIAPITAPAQSPAPARLRIWIAPPVQIGVDNITRAGATVDVQAGTHVVSAAGHSFEWQAIAGESYTLQLIAVHLADDSAVQVFRATPAVALARDGRVVASAAPASKQIGLAGPAALFATGSSSGEARIEIARGLVFRGLSGQLLDGRRFSCGDGFTDLFEAGRFISKASACGRYVRSRSISVLPGTFTVEVFYHSATGAAGPLYASIQIGAGETAQISADTNVKWTGPDQVRLVVVKASGK